MNRINTHHGRKFGTKKDRYRPAKYYKISKASIPLQFTLPDIAPVRDQGNEGSCVGFGVGGASTSIAMKLSVFSEWFSPRWIYNGARFIEGSLTQEGAYPQDAIDWIIEKGILLEHFWPYVDDLNATPPSSSFDPEAAKFPVLDYQRLTGGVNSIADAIYNGNYVMLGIPWYYSWMSTNANGQLPNIGRNTYVVGGHEIYAYGYDLTAGYFYCSNSWGSSWGKDGRFLLPTQAFQYFGRAGGYDAHIITVNWQPAPPTPPTPPVPPTPDPTKHNITIYASIDQAESFKVGDFECPQ